MGIRLIAVDMDGTLLGADHVHVSQRTIAALRAASALGVKIVVATGRNVNLLREPADSVGAVDYVISANGAGVMDYRTGAWMERIGLPSPQWEAMLGILHARGLSVETYADGEAYVTMADLEGAADLGFDRSFVDDYIKKVRIVDRVEEAVAGKCVEKLHVFYVPPGEKDSLIEELTATGPVLIANAEPTNLELTAPGADKGKALERLCASLGIAAGDVMAFGDGGNDLGMLAWAGWSFAMENGSDEVKETARYRAAANDEDGVAKAVEKYLLHP